jgi:hypothetical protein
MRRSGLGRNGAHDNGLMSVGMEQPHNHYHSFLIRLWLEEQDDEAGAEWRIELESIQSGQKYRFPDLEAMFQFFRDQINIAQMEQTKNKSQEKDSQAG